MPRVIIAAIIAGILLHAWSFASWMFLPWHTATMHTFEDEAAVMSSVQEWVGTAHGLYYFPSWPAEETQESMAAFTARHEAGPVGLIIANPGHGVMEPLTIVRGVATNLLIALTAAALLAAAREKLRLYWQRVLFVVGLGVVVALMAHVNYWNWMGFPTDYTVVMIADHLVGMLLAGVVLAALIKAPAAEAAA